MSEGTGSKNEPGKNLILDQRSKWIRYNYIIDGLCGFLIYGVAIMGSIYWISWVWRQSEHSPNWMKIAVISIALGLLAYFLKSLFYLAKDIIQTRKAIKDRPHQDEKEVVIPSSCQWKTNQTNNVSPLGVETKLPHKPLLPPNIQWFTIQEVQAILSKEEIGPFIEFIKTNTGLLGIAFEGAKFDRDTIQSFIDFKTEHKTI